MVEEKSSFKLQGMPKISAVQEAPPLSALTSRKGRSRKTCARQEVEDMYKVLDHLFICSIHFRMRDAVDIKYIHDRLGLKGTR